MTDIKNMSQEDIRTKEGRDTNTIKGLDKDNKDIPEEKETIKGKDLEKNKGKCQDNVKDMMVETEVHRDRVTKKETGKDKENNKNRDRDQKINQETNQIEINLTLE